MSGTHSKDSMIEYELEEIIRKLLPYARNEAAGLADVDEDKHANKAWRIIRKAEKLIGES